ncbi:MAG: hypothetical protein WC765_07620, partial [Phycisphaerae bacterium]
RRLRGLRAALAAACKDGRRRQNENERYKRYFCGNSIELHFITPILLVIGNTLAEYRKNRVDSKAVHPTKLNVGRHAGLPLQKALNLQFI